MRAVSGPDSPSGDYTKMVGYLDMVDAILGGTDTMRAKGESFLPQFPEESDAAYKARRESARFTNIFGDIVETLSAKPFEKEVSIENADPVKDLLEDVDGQGNNANVFSSRAFYWGVADSITWVLVDYMNGVPVGSTRAEEKKAGARPYVVHIRQKDLLAVYSENIAGVDTIVHARIREDETQRVGFGEKTVARVRVLNRDVEYDDKGRPVRAGAATWELHEKQSGGKDAWLVVDNGEFSIGVIPLVPFITGRRLGASWVMRPVLQSAAHLQIEHYQQESELKYIRQLTAFPMLSGNGVEPDRDANGDPKPAPVGPFAVLYAPPSLEGPVGSWSIIEAAGSSLNFCSTEVDKTERQLRELGRQPLTAQSGNITTITAAFAGDKAHTVIEAWALNFTDFLENCLKLMARWRNSEIEPKVEVCTDFALSVKEDTGVDSLDAARDRGDISAETWFDEAKRRAIIGPNRTYEQERERLIAEAPGEPDEDLEPLPVAA